MTSMYITQKIEFVNHLNKKIQSISIICKKNSYMISVITFIFDITNCLKYSLQGTTQGNGLTGGLPPVRFSM